MPRQAAEPGRRGLHRGASLESATGSFRDDDGDAQPWHLCRFRGRCSASRPSSFSSSPDRRRAARNRAPRIASRLKFAAAMRRPISRRAALGEPNGAALARLLAHRGSRFRRRRPSRIEPGHALRQRPALFGRGGSPLHRLRRGAGHARVRLCSRERRRYRHILPHRRGVLRPLGAGRRPGFRRRPCGRIARQGSAIGPWSNGRLRRDPDQ